MGSSGSKEKVTDQDKAILDLKLQRDSIKQYQKRIRVVLDREHEIAKECLAKGDKRRALLALRQRKYQEQMLVKTDQQLESLQELTNSIEFALVQKDVMYGLQEGNKVLKELNKEMSLDKVEKIMEESADAVAYQNEVSDMLASKISNSDEDEVQDELERMEQEELARQGKVPSLPDAPTKQPESTKPNEEEEGEETEPERSQALPA